MSEVSFETLLGKTFTKIENDGNDVLKFICDNGEVYQMYHSQECCETVTLDDICGDLDFLVGTPILLAREAFDSGESRDLYSYTYTFYHLATMKGYVTLRWCGSSNGYYSESVDLYRIHEKTEATDETDS